MKHRYLTALAVALMVAAALTGCATAKVLTNPNATFPVAISDTAPAFLFPVNLSHLGSSGDPTLMGVTVTAGVIDKFGKTVVSGQQLIDLVGNLSYELAETIDSQAKAGEWMMTGSAETVASALATLMSQIMAMLADLQLVPAGYNFKYIIAVHSHGSGSMVPGTLDVESWGGLYDVETKEILSYISTTAKLADQEAAILGQMPGTYNTIIQHLIDGK